MAGQISPSYSSNIQTIKTPKLDLVILIVSSLQMKSTTTKVLLDDEIKSVSVAVKLNIISPPPV